MPSGGDRPLVFVHLALDGMNYRASPAAAYAHYREFEFLMNNWDGEKAILDRWCSIVGLPRDGYTVHRDRVQGAVGTRDRALHARRRAT